MARFTERMDEIRKTAEAVAPDDAFVVLSDNLSHLGNGTFAVSIKRERDEPRPDEDNEPGVDMLNDTLATAFARPGDDLAMVAAFLKAQLAR